MADVELSSLTLSSSQLELLHKGGFRTARELGGYTADLLASELNVGEDEASRLLADLAQQADVGADDDADHGESALDLLKERRTIPGIVTFCQELDDLLGGGVACGEVTEFCGVPGVGKTQIAMQVAVDAAVPEVFFGVEGRTIYVDTEGSFTPERAQQMAEALVAHLRFVASVRPHFPVPTAPTYPAHAPASRRAQQQGGDGGAAAAAAARVTVRSVLEGISVYRVHDHVQQLAVVAALPRLLREDPRVRLVVVDSVTFHFRQEFADYAARTQLLTSMAQQLHAAARAGDCAVLLVNQVTTRLRQGEGYLVPALGESWAHACTHRVMLTMRGGVRTAEIVKSPYRPPGRAVYAVTTAGVRGVAGEAAAAAASAAGGVQTVPGGSQGEIPPRKRRR